MSGRDDDGWSHAISDHQDRRDHGRPNDTRDAERAYEAWLFGDNR